MAKQQHQRERTLWSICLSFFLCSCTPALPGEDPAVVGFNSRVLAERSALEAKTHAEGAEQNLQRMDELMQEVRTLAARADEALKKCDTAAKLAKAKPKKIFVKCKEEKPKETAAAPAEPTKPAEAGPEYSPSDAPVR